MTKPFMLLSCPKQGTDFFVKSLISSNQKVIYHREYFNPLCNTDRYNLLSESFGDSHHNEDKLWSFDCNLDAAYNAWLNDGNNFTKENYLVTKLDYFAEKFDMCFLYRSRFHTFPSSKPEFIEVLLDSFLKTNITKWPRYADTFSRLQAYLLSKEYTSQVKPVIAHTLHWYFAFKEASRLSIPVIDFDYVMLQDEENINQALSVIPAWCYKKVAAANFVKNRKSKLFLQQREQGYADLEAEPHVQEFFRIIEEIDPDFCSTSLYEKLRGL